MTRLRNQSNLDGAVRDVCCLLETPPWSLGVVATAKGLIAGPLTMHHKDGATTECMTSGGKNNICRSNYLRKAQNFKNKCRDCILRYLFSDKLT